MLSIKPIGSSGQEVGYYASLGQEDYYVAGGEPPGCWCGQGAARLKLSGQVTGKLLAALLSGKGVGGQALVQNAGDSRRRAGFDLTWSVPKSVSVAMSQANRAEAKQIEQASELAVMKVLETLEEFCGKSRRGKRGLQTEDAGLVAALFRHNTARGVPGQTPDPNLHFHLVLANVSVREDGTTGALDARALFTPHMKMALGALFRAELSKNLLALGYASERPTDDRGRKKSWFELTVIPKPLLEEFSKRRREIEVWLRTRGLSGAKASEKAANATRRKKEAYTREELRTAWQAIGKAHGFSPDLLRAAREGKAMQSMVTTPESVVTEALRLITDDRARFSEVELLRFAAQEAQTTGLGIGEIRCAVTSALLNRTEIVKLKSVDGIAQYTTQEMLHVERQLLEAAAQGRFGTAHRVSAAKAAATIGHYDTLCSEQVAAVKHLTCRAGNLVCVNGMAGTGKTFLLSVARDIWQHAGYEVIGTALAAKASKTLEDGSGIESSHLHRLLFELETKKRHLSAKTVVVLDEAAMVGTRLLARLVHAVDRAGAKLAMIGDHRQLQAINAGAPFRVLAEELGVVELTDIRRQREDWSRNVVRDLAAGKSVSALKQLHKHGNLAIAADRDASIHHLVADWHSDFSCDIDARIFAGTRAETATINRLCQRARLLAGELGKESLEVGGNRIHAQDRVVITKNDRFGILSNGTAGTVLMVHTASQVLHVRLDTGLCVQIAVNEFDHLQLGYCTTTHKGQGQTVESAFVLAGGVMTDREISYVQGSRARGRTRFYADVESGGETIEELARQMNRSRRKDLAHEYLLEGT